MATDKEHYLMNMICGNCDGHSTMSFKRGEPCKIYRAAKTEGSKKSREELVQYLCPHCGCLEARATTRAAGI